MFRRRMLRAFALASVTSLAAWSTGASAQQIDRIVVFGDSYADTGNFFRLVGVNPLTTSIYTTGRFSGGSNYIDSLSQTLQVPVYNFAIGGARTNNTNQTAGAPGFTFEVQQFLAGGGSNGFPAVTTTLDRSDLVAVSIGGNDARAYQLGGGSLAGASAAAATAVTSFQSNFDLVEAKGTPTISFLAGDTGKLPEIAANPTGAAIRTAYSTAFNSGVQSILAGYANRGSIVHYLDLTTILGDINANPAGYGLAGITCPALPNTTCVADTNAPYLTYVDGLHLTSKGFAIVAQYVDRQLAAPLTLGGPADLELDTARQWQRTLSSRTDLYRYGAPQTGLRIYAVGDAFQRGVPASDQNSAFTINGGGGTVGAEYGFGTGLIGVAGNYSRTRLGYNNDAAFDHVRTWQAGIYASMAADGFFGEAYAGFGKDRNRMRRTGVVEGMAANPHGSHTVAGAKGGYLFPFMGFQMGPVIGLDYARAKVNGYTETGDPALALTVSRQSLKALTGQAGLEFRGELAGLHPFVDATLEKDFTGDHRVIDFAQTTSPTIVNHWDINRSKRTYGKISGGGTADLTPGIAVDAFVSTTINRRQGQEIGGQLSLKAKF